MRWLNLCLSVVICFLLPGCNEQKKNDPAAGTSIASAGNADIKRPSQQYIAYCDSISALVKKWRSQKNLSSIKKLVYHSIAVDMPLYWHGTKWDFNGTTRTAGDSSIACGYFITTLLQDIGLKVNRSWLAQQPSSVLIKTTCNNIKRLADFNDLRKYLGNLPANSICIVGLDFHTGFIVKDKDNTWFFHSNYIGRAGVTKELTDDSRALKNNKTFMIGNLTENAEYLML